MSEKEPPSPFPLNPVFNPNDWIPENNTTIDIAYLDANYLRYPSAQGTETLQTINVNGIATFSNKVNVGTQGIDCSGNLLVVDYTGSGQNTEMFKLVNIANVSTTAFILNPQSAGYNPIQRLDDTMLGFGQNNGAFANFCLIPFSQTACGLRITKDNLLIGAGGTTSGGVPIDPTQNIFFDGLNNTMTITSSNFRVGATMNLITNGTGIRFPDNTLQTTAYTGASNGATYTINYYDTGVAQTITMPTGCRRVDVLLVGRGGDAGIYSGGVYGGSGSGGNSTWGQGLPMYEGEQFFLSFSSTNTTGYTLLTRVANPNVEIARAYNGNPGLIGGSPGASNTANAGTGNTSFGIWTFGYGNVGANGTSTPPDMTGTGQALTRGTPFGVRTWAITKYGCAQRAPVGSPTAGANQLSGYCSITYYIGS